MNGPTLTAQLALKHICRILRMKRGKVFQAYIDQICMQIFQI